MTNSAFAKKYSAHVGVLCTCFPGAEFLVAAIMLVVMLMLVSVYVVNGPDEAGSGGVFTALGRKEVDFYDAYTMLPRFSGNDAVITHRQSVERNEYSIQFMYFLRDRPWADTGVYSVADGNGVLATPARIAAVQAFEATFEAMAGWSTPPGTAAATGTVRCQLEPVNASAVDSPEAIPDTCNATAVERQKPAGWKCKDHTSPTTGTTTKANLLPSGTTRGTAVAARALFPIGGPLPCYPNVFVDARDQDELITKWGADEVIPVFEAGRDALAPVGLDVVVLAPGVIGYYLGKIIQGDLAFVAVAAVMVAALILILSRSVMLTLCGIMHVMLSYYGAWAIYRAAGYTIFPGLLQMAIFILLGIGADDIFVMLDAWVRSHSETSSNINESLAIKISVVTARAARAMFVTSFTTFAAFVCTAASPIPSISAFGVYTSIAVVLNYLFVITWFPAIVVIWHKYFEFRPVWMCCCAGMNCCTHKPPPSLTYFWKMKATGCSRGSNAEVAPDTDVEAASGSATADVLSPMSPASRAADTIVPRNAPPNETSIVAGGVPNWIREADARVAASGGRIGVALFGASEEPREDEPYDVMQLTAAERIFHNWVFPTVRLLRVPILVVFLAMLIIGSVYAADLKGDGDNDLGLPEDNIVSIIFELVGDVFTGSSSASGPKMCLVHGLDAKNPIDRSGVDPNSEDWLGEPKFDLDGFEFTAGVVRTTALTCISLMRNGTRAAVTGTATVRFNISTDELRDVPCVAATFALWLRETTPPIGNPEAAGTFDVGRAIDLNALEAAALLAEPYASATTAQLTQLLAGFLDTSGGAWASRVGFVREGSAREGGRALRQTTTVPAVVDVRWITACFDMAIPAQEEVQMDDVDAWAAWRDAQVARYGTAFEVVSRSFSSRVSQIAMRESTISSAMISLVVVLIVSILFTGSIVISLITVVCIGLILAVIFAYMVWRGWPLNFIEAIALTVLVGISVDFTVHYATAYTEAPFTTRQRRLRYAMTTMGTSVVSGAVTTLAAAFLLFFTTFQFFRKFGEFMFVAILMSFVVCNTLFPAIVFFVGPEGHCLDVHYGVRLLFAACGVSACAPSKPSTEIREPARSPLPATRGRVQPSRHASVDRETSPRGHLPGGGHVSGGYPPPLIPPGDYAHPEHCVSAPSYDQSIHHTPHGSHVNPSGPVVTPYGPAYVPTPSVYSSAHAASGDRSQGHGPRRYPQHDQGGGAGPSPAYAPRPPSGHAAPAYVPGGRYAPRAPTGAYDGSGYNHYGHEEAAYDV
eukprot:TRINITY_DN14_c0_g1_i1.p1 TRINITY_DN14_c0_g1~~TRINITY_DN14_c0_g1_i1.p1  ORF type:complete len:1271 (+),score=328.06 TRINITY_DN14_c0_g1_i1:159-3971(+)